MDASIGGLSPKTLNYLNTVFQRYSKIEQVLLFGSRAQDTYSPYSDIDLAISAPNMTSREFAKLWEELEELPLIYKLDCVHLETVRNRALKSKIVNYGHPFGT